MVYMNTNRPLAAPASSSCARHPGWVREVGNISGMLQAEEETKTPLTRQLDTLTRQIFLDRRSGTSWSSVVHQPSAQVRTFTAIFPRRRWPSPSVPCRKNMPAVVTTILALPGTQALAKVGAIMKRLQSTETLGSTLGHQPPTRPAP